MRDARDLETAGEGWLWLDPPPHDALQVRQEHAGGRCRKGRGPGHLGLLREHRALAGGQATGLLGLGRHAAEDGHPRHAPVRTPAPVAIFDDQSRFQGAIGVQDVLKAVVPTLRIRPASKRTASQSQPPDQKSRPLAGSFCLVRPNSAHRIRQEENDGGEQQESAPAV